MNGNGPITWKQVVTSVSLVAGLSTVVGGYYVMGYRVEAAEKTAQKALEATVEIPVIKRDIEYIRKDTDAIKQELNDSRTRQHRSLELLEDIQRKVKP